MKKMTQIGMLMLGLMVAFAGCDAAKKVAGDKMADMAGIEFGDFDMKGLMGKFTGITDGFKDVNADNVDGLTSKITDLSGSIDGLGIDKLAGPAKEFAGKQMTTFGGAVEKAMGGVSDEGLLGKLKPAVDGLMGKLNAFK